MSKTINIDTNIELVSRLKDISLMKSLSELEFEEMLKLSKITHYGRDEIIIKEKYYDNRIYFLISGKVEISKEGQKLKTLESTGDTFGEMSVIEGKERSATIRSLEETICLAIDASFAERLRKDQKLNLLDKLFTEILAARLRNTTVDYAHALNTIKKLQEENKTLHQLVTGLKILQGKQAQLIADTENELDTSFDVCQDDQFAED